MDQDPKKRPVVPRTISGFVSFTFKEILRQKKWILIPIWVLLAALALLIFLGGGTSLLPAIYIAF